MWWLQIVFVFFCASVFKKIVFHTRTKRLFALVLKNTIIPEQREKVETRIGTAIKKEKPKDKVLAKTLRRFLQT